MTKIIWMTDPHFQDTGTINGLNPRTRLAAAIDHVNTQHADADFAVITGDLLGDENAGDYTLLEDYLARSAVPVYPMVGNNDNRAGLRAHLTLPDGTMADFIQYAINTGDGVMICLDTQMIGSHAGEFCGVRRTWLTETLQANGDKPAYIFMHHPPMDLGLPKQDEIKLTDGDSFLDLIQTAGNVQHLFMGHVHRPTCGSIRGIPFATLGAVSFQAPAPRPAWDWDSFVAVAEAPHYGVVNIGGGAVTVQFTQFCDYAVGVES